MSKPYQPLTSADGLHLRAQSLAFWREQLRQAQALTEHRVQLINDFCARGGFCRPENVQILAGLTQGAGDAKSQANHARERLVREFLEYVKAGGTGEETP